MFSSRAGPGSGARCYHGQVGLVATTILPSLYYDCYITITILELLYLLSLLEKHLNNFCLAGAHSHLKD